MRHLFFPLAIFLSVAGTAQKKYISLSFFNTQTDMPFAKLTGMFTDAFHPGVEFSYGNNLVMKKNHDWFLEYKLAYFYHRFVQHGMPLYANLGYRYHFSHLLSAETSLGGGFMKSIPATQVFRQQFEGYEKEKRKGREQLIATYGIGLNYTFNPSAKHPIRIITSYQQRIQFPFVKSYVPLLPYNSFMLGISKSIGKNKFQHALKKNSKPLPFDRLFIQKTSKH